ncbi:MAG: NHL domain-containing thioredoxin family protein [Bifidobacteriaceae bacterium]|jgi:thiol-disulfide isomerase/thioredoxin|nr:NHL domain-containing thioredoxin family protein [Bifidobacteriaceae bacterium]
MRASELKGRGWLGAGGRGLKLEDLRGKIVILDFWTFCCINCLHVLDELRQLERQFEDVLVIVGVHSPKFAHEADPDALRAAVERYEVSHPVLDDPDLTTWRAYGARAWPTLVVIDTEGNIAAQMAGEGHAANLTILIRELADKAEKAGTLRRGGGPYVPPEPAPGVLRFPSKAIRLTGAGTLLVADAGHHSLAELDRDGALIRRIGSGERGLTDGAPAQARFAEPSGVAELPPRVAQRAGYQLLVADTVNHVLRGVRLPDGRVTTVAGTGRAWLPSDPVAWFAPPPPGAAAVAGSAVVGSAVADQSGADHGVVDDAVADHAGARRVALSSPWDVAWSERLGAVVVAMAGIHMLWAFDPVTGRVGRLAGTGREGLMDGPADQAWLAQPSGLAVRADGEVWFADSETSALRVLDLGPDGAEVRTAVGRGLFDFGHVDGPAAKALLQHPLGLAVLPDGRIAIADTYNGAVRLYSAAPGAGGVGGAGGVDGAGGAELAEATVSTLAQGLNEPSDILVDGPADADGETRLLVVESGAHRITALALPDAVWAVDGGAQQTRRPVLEVLEGVLALTVPFTPPAGQKADDRFGPSSHLEVSATPPELLLAGAGSTVELERELVLGPGQGVLHVTARAASCDSNPDAEHAACHLSAQDWGVPILVGRRGAAVPDPPGPQTLTLPLLA